MREKPCVLKDIADAAAVRRQEGARLRVHQNLVLNGHPPAVGPQKARHGIDHRGLARSRAAEEGGDPGRRVEGRLQPEARESVRERDRQRHVPAILRATARLTHSDKSSAAMAMTMATSTSRAACTSPPGTCR